MRRIEEGIYITEADIIFHGAEMQPTVKQTKSQFRHNEIRQITTSSFTDIVNIQWTTFGSN